MSAGALSPAKSLSSQMNQTRIEFRGNSHWPFEARRKNIPLCDFVNLNYGVKDIANLIGVHKSGAADF